MKIRQIFFLGFIMLFVQYGHSMCHEVGSRLTSRNDTLGSKYSTTKLDAYYANISDIKKKPIDTEDEVVGVLDDALKNIEDAFRIIDSKWSMSSDMRESPTVQKMYCKRALYEFYWTLHDKFKNVNSPEATQIREKLKRLGIIE